MGIVDWLSDAGDWFTEHLKNTGQAYKDAWTKNLMENSQNLYSGTLTMLQSPSRGGWSEFGKGLRLWGDSLLGLGGDTLFKGTIGGAFELPVLHEAGWLLDKAYRYAWAYPTSYWMQTSVDMARIGREASKDGATSAWSAQLSYLMDHVPWGNHGIWSTEAQSMTPGQGLMWAIGSQIGMLNPQNTKDPTQWIRTNDPRTPEGKARYSGPDADFLLKYGSGSVDLLANVVVDPSVPAAGLLMAGKRRFDHVATADYVAKGGVDKEVSTARYESLLKTAKEIANRDGTPEEFRKLALNRNTYGGRVAPVLLSAVKISDGLFRDVYSVARGMDGVFSPTGGGAWKRIQDQAPEIASSLSRQFANWNLGEDMIAYGRNADSTAVVSSLALNDADAFVMSLKKFQGAWGQLPGLLAEEAQPRVNKLDRIRAGFHDKVMDASQMFASGNRYGVIPGALIQVGKPLVRTVQAFMASQGHTRYLDSWDGTALSLRQLKANLERADMPADRVEWWASQWGAKNTPEGRDEIYYRANEEALRAVTERHGITPDVLERALPEINRYQSAARQIVSQQRVYISERAQLLGAKLVAESRKHQNAFIRDLSAGLSRKARKGEYDDAMLAIPNVDGVTSLQPVPDSRLLPEQGADPHRPVTISQTERLIPTIDYRALDSALKWWKLQHPPKMGRDLSTNELKSVDDLQAQYGPASHMVDGEKVLQWEELPTSAGRAVLSKVAKVHSAWNSLLTTSDFINMVWKASALLRPAQMPRNLADDIFRRMLVLGKGHLIMSSMRGAKRVYQNAGPRGKLVHEIYGRKRVQMQAEGNTTLRATVDLDDLEAAALANDKALRGAAVKKATAMLKKGNVDEALKWAEQNPHLPDDLGMSFLNGDIGWDTLVEALQSWGATAYQHGRIGYLETLLDRWEKRTLKTGDIRGGGSFLSLPGGAADLRRKLEEEEKGNNAAEMTNEFKRQLLEYYGQRLGTKIAFLDAHEPNMFETRTRSDMGKWIEDLVALHMSRLNSDTPYRPGQLIVHPLTGSRPKGDANKLENFTIITEHNLNHMVKNDGTLNLNVTRWLEAFILRHLDHFTDPNTFLTLTVNPAGSIRMGVARPRSQSIAGLPPIEVSPRRKLRNFKFDGIRDAGHDGLSVAFMHKDKEVYTESYDFEGARQGEEGELFHNRLSAAAGQGSHNYIVGDFNQDRIFDQMSGQWGYSTPGERGYAKQWERVVNAQLGSDPVAQMFLQGSTEHDVLRWIEETPEGTTYVQRSKFHGVAYSDHVSQIKGMVEDYIPFADNAAGKLLRQAVLEKKAEYRHLQAVEPDVAKQPVVHGASTDFLLGKGAIFKFVARGLDKMQKLLSDLPVDKASRFPFFDEAYKRHLNELVRMADERTWMAHKDAEVIPEEQLRNLRRQAQERALYDTKYRLYDVAQVNDLARMSRYIVPFASAIMDSYIKYGRIVRDTWGGAALKGLYYWEMFDRNEAVQDENGYVERYAAGGEKQWFKVDPKTKELTQVPDDQVGEQRYVQFSLPSDLANVVGLGNYFGTKTNPVFAVNRKSFNVFIDLPSTGPMVALPANEFSLKNPEFGESTIIKKFVLPFGPSTNTGKIILPTTVRTAWDAFVTEDGEKAEAQAKAIFQAELISYGRGERDNPPSLVEAREKAAALKGLRFSSAWITPVSMQAVSPYQMYIDTYRQMVQQVETQKALDPSFEGNADEQFLHQYGDEYYAVAMSVTRNNAGIRASLESNKAFKAHKDLIDAYPEYAGLIVGADGGAFSKSVYESQKVTPLKTGSSTMVRQVLHLDESVEDLEKRRVWNAYSNMQDQITAELADRGLASLRSNRAKDLRAVRDAFVKQNMTWIDPTTGREALSPWYRDFTVVDQAAMANRINALREIIRDPDMQNRDDIRGLAEYLSARDRFQQKMAKAGLKSLSGQGALAALAAWEKKSFSIRESNPAFAAVWSRYLSNDDSLEQ